MEVEDAEDDAERLRGPSHARPGPGPGCSRIGSSGAPGPEQIRVANGSPVVVTPGKGKVLLQRTGGPGGALKVCVTFLSSVVTNYSNY